MRTIIKTAAAVILVVSLAVPAEAASRSSRPSFYQAAKRFIIRVLSRVSPPVGSPTTLTPEDTETTTTTTTAPATTP